MSDDTHGDEPKQDGGDAIGAVPTGKGRYAPETYPRLYARVAPAMRAQIMAMRSRFAGTVDGEPASVSEVVRQVLVIGLVAMDDEFVRAAVALKKARGMRTMDEAWVAILRAGIKALGADPPGSDP